MYIREIPTRFYLLKKVISSHAVIFTPWVFENNKLLWRQIMDCMQFKICKKLVYNLEKMW